MKAVVLLVPSILGLCPSMAPDVPSDEEVFQLTQTSQLYDGEIELSEKNELHC